MEQNYSRKNNQKNKPSSSNLNLAIILLLLINIMALLGFAYLSLNQTTTQEQRLEKMETKLNSLDPSLSKTNVAVNTVSSVEQQNSLPVTTGNTTESSTSAPTVNTVSPPLEETQQSQEPIVTPEQSYIVQPGDTLSAIAEKHSLSVEDLMNKNNLTDSVVLIGQELVFN